MANMSCIKIEAICDQARNFQQFYLNNNKSLVINRIVPVVFIIYLVLVQVCASHFCVLLSLTIPFINVLDSVKLSSGC